MTEGLMQRGRSILEGRYLFSAREQLIKEFYEALAAQEQKNANLRRLLGQCLFLLEDEQGIDDLMAECRKAIGETDEIS